MSNSENIRASSFGFLSSFEFRHSSFFSSAVRRPPSALLLLLIAACGCAAARLPQAAIPDPAATYQAQYGSLDVHSDFPVSGQANLFAELAARREELYRELALAGSNEPVEIYLFANAEAMNVYRQRWCRGLSTRRAFFVQTAAQLAVYAQGSDRLGDDLRHETAHAFLHAVIPNIPLWLDEGLAVYYETPRGSRGLNPLHLRWLSGAMAGGVWHPDLARLEQFSPATDMRQADYAEAWAWIHFLLQSRPERADLLRSYLADVRHGGRVEPLASRLRRTLDNPEAMLLEHLRALLSGRLGM
jgi:hypothetical protein